MDDSCNETRHMELMDQAAATGTHFFFGSSPKFAAAESHKADALGRLLYHCCVG
jgi:hypothetical protein